MLTQQQAVEKALEALGPEALPTAIREWLKSELKITMTNSAISSCKWQARKNASERNGHSGLNAADIHSLKGLLSRVGREELTKVIEVLE